MQFDVESYIPLSSHGDFFESEQPCFEVDFESAYSQSKTCFNFQEKSFYMIIEEGS
jgi:hypothetical protein